LVCAYDDFFFKMGASLQPLHQSDAHGYAPTTITTIISLIRFLQVAIADLQMRVVDPCSHAEADRSS
jgi:hypothetical protein